MVEKLRGDVSDALMTKGQEVRWGGGVLRIILGEKSVGLGFGVDWGLEWRVGTPNGEAAGWWRFFIFK